MALTVQSLTIENDGKTLVSEVSLSVAAGRMTAILGANGAGKSELVLGIAGMLPASAGRVLVDGTDITNKTPEIIRRAGVAVVPEGHQVLSHLSVKDNLRAAGSIFGNMEEGQQKVLHIFPELEVLQDQTAGTLSGGQQQMVALGHALMARPKYLILDEMSLGLAPVVVNRLMTAIRQLCDDGVGVLLIEQFTDLALQNADFLTVLRQGSVAFTGAPADIRRDDSILQSAYFG